MNITNLKLQGVSKNCVKILAYFQQLKEWFSRFSKNIKHRFLDPCSL